MAFLIGVAVASLFFAVLFFFFVDRPARKLIELMEQAPEKNFLVRAPSRRRDVIGRLYRSFNTLLERITTLDATQLETEREMTALQDKLHLQKTLEARLNELRLIYEFSKQVSTTLEVDELYSTVERFIGDHLGFHEFALLVLEEAEGPGENAKLSVKVARGFSDEKRVLGMTFQEGEGITGRTLQKAQMIYIPDTSHSEEYLHYKGQKQEDGSFLSMPLLFKKKVVGVLNMFRKGVDAFSPEEMKFLDTLTVELAIAVVNTKLYSKTRELSVRDELTQLYNRRYFQEILPLEIKRSQRFKRPLSLLMIDIDHFKRFNDRFGHLVGDECLKEFVRVVNSRIREVDFFARFGGEEFVLILPGTPKQDGVLVAEKIRALVKEHAFRSGSEDERLRSERLTVSVGVAAYPDDARTVEELIDAADIALYEAKNGGRDRVNCYEPLKQVSSS
ncbi:MAG TPA: diguanylate cyclase [bacterium]|nr:diguanylate cyclase [bacterium]